jgi:hypothetical protein
LKLRATSDAQRPSVRLLAVEGQRLTEEGGMRVSAAFNRLLGLLGASVRAVRFDADGVIVTVALRRRRRICSGCGQLCRATHDTVSRAGGTSIWAPSVATCGLHAAAREVPGRRRQGRAGPVGAPAQPLTRDFEDVVAYLAQQMPKDPIARLMRI